ncbi:MAG: hypothetical protein HY048_18965 [Acidobacteria bacterium]|nr:hypothetical protein [Acidobacteriota bacterium]
MTLHLRTPLTRIASSLVFAGALSSAAAASPPGGAILRVHVTSAVRSIDGTCVLIHQRHEQGGTVLYFLTSAHLFEDAGPHRVRVKLNAWETIDVAADGMFVPASTPGEIAILRAVTKTGAYAGLVTVPIAFDPPATGDVFVVSGLDPAGARATSAQRVLFSGAQFLIGDRPPADLHDCAGAPALLPAGVYGLVSECGSGLPPVVSLLSPARAFIADHVPGWDASPSRTTQYEVVWRDTAGPVLTVACDDVRTGAVQVPVQMMPRQTLVDATAEFTSPQSLRLGDVIVDGVMDHAVKVRFTMVGVPPPLTKDPGAVCPQGQALVTIKATLVQWP